MGEAPEAAMAPSLSLVTPTFSCSAMFLRPTTLTPLAPPQRLETACTTSPTPPLLLASPATTPLLPTTRMPLCNTLLRLALLVLLCTLQAGVDTALVSTLDALMTATLLSTTPCSWLATAPTRPREITGL